MYEAAYHRLDYEKATMRIDSHWSKLKMLCMKCRIKRSCKVANDNYITDSRVLTSVHLNQHDNIITRLNISTTRKLKIQLHVPS